MKDLNEMTTELEHIEAVQDALGVIKKNLRAIQRINQDEGRHEAANAAMKARGQTIVLHAEMMNDLAQYFPDHASEIQVRGGGGRGG